MRILVASTGNHGHFRPLVPLARACESAGHDIRVVVPESFVSAASQAGFDTIALGEPRPEEFAAINERIGELSAGGPAAMFDPRVRDATNQIMLRDVFGRVDANAALPRMRAVIDEWHPDRVLREPAEVASLVAAESAGVAHAQIGIGVTALVKLVVGHLSEPFEEHEARGHLVPGSLTDAALSAPLFTTVPARFDTADGAPAGGAEPHRFRGASGAAEKAGELPSWGDARAPLAYVTFGSVTGTMPAGALYGQILAALGALDARVLLTTGPGLDPEALRPWPANAHVVQWWPQAAIMDRTAVVVGHGGFGTTMTALASGVPQVVVPLFASDQWLNAARIETLGAGVQLVAGFDVAERILEAARSVLGDSSYRTSAQGLADEIAQLPPADDMVEHVVAAA